MESLALGPIAQIALRVHDVPAAIAYYRDRLGLPFLFTAPTPGSGTGPGMAFFDCGGIRLLLGRPEGEADDHPGSVLYFRVEDMGAAHRELSQRGVEFVEGPGMVADLGRHELWLAFFRDPWENPLALLAEIPKAV
ncbi:MAG TPA: VOC family protein [Longimicrobiales bacterium]|nr:VOC family protein [Longimicrobiales bacterium]